MDATEEDGCQILSNEYHLNQLQQDGGESFDAKPGHQLCYAGFSVNKKYYYTELF